MISRDDLAAMVALASASWRERGPYVEHHPGDIAWGAHPSAGEANGLLDGEAYAFVDGDEWHVGGNGIDRMLDAARDAGGTVLALEAERDKAEGLAARGYARDESAWMWHYARDLSSLPPMVLEPSAYDLDERVALHRAAWDGSLFRREVYDGVRATPPYDPELDVVVRAPDGTAAAYVIAWYDAGSASGELEPVGTSREHRRRGFGHAACLAALHRLRDRGARTAVVYAVSDPANPGPRALYESLGFEAVDRHVRWTIGQNAPRGGN